ncbi:hypothetical protein ACJX0J_021045, partial [Zea mays]
GIIAISRDLSVTCVEGCIYIPKGKLVITLGQQLHIAFKELSPNKIMVMFIFGSILIMPTRYCYMIIAAASHSSSLLQSTIKEKTHMAYLSDTLQEWKIDNEEDEAMASKSLGGGDKQEMGQEADGPNGGNLENILYFTSKHHQLIPVQLLKLANLFH